MSEDAFWSGQLVEESDQPWQWYDPARYDEPKKRERQVDPRIIARHAFDSLPRGFTKNLAYTLPIIQKLTAEQLVIFTDLVERALKPKSVRKRLNHADMTPEQLEQEHARRKAYLARSMTPERLMRKRESAKRSMQRHRDLIPLTDEQRRAKNARDRARRDRLREAEGKMPRRKGLSPEALERRKRSDRQRKKQAWLRRKKSPASG